MTIDHNHPEYITAMELYIHGDRGEAKKTFEELLKKYPKDPNLYLLLGNINYALGHLSDATNNYKKALDLEPNLTIALFQLGVCLVRMGRLNEALACFSKNAESDSQGHVMSYYWMGLINSFLGNDEASFVAFKRLHEESEESMLADYFLAQMHLKRHEEHEALELLEKLVKVSPKFAEVHYLMGQAYAELHQNMKAIQKFQDVLKLNPEDKRAKAAFELYTDVPSI